MAVDIVPELKEKIWQEFDKKVASSKKIKAFNEKLKDKKATEEDVSQYAIELGNIAASVLLDCLHEEILPNGRMYYNIADRTIRPLLEQTFDMVMNAAIAQQSIDDKKIKIGLKASAPKFPEQKINDLMLKFSDLFDKVENE